MGRQSLFVTLISAAALGGTGALADTVAVVDGRSNVKSTSFINSPASTHVAGFHNNASINLSQVSDSGGQNHFYSGFGAAISDTGTITYDTYAANIQYNRVIAKATGSTNNTLNSYFGTNSVGNTVNYNLTNAFGGDPFPMGYPGTFSTRISGSPGGSVATLNSVTLNLNGDVSWNRVATNIDGNAISNTIINTLNDSPGNIIQTTMGRVGIEGSAVSGNQVSNSLLGGDNIAIQTVFNFGASQNSVVTTDEGGRDNKFYTGFGVFLYDSPSGYTVNPQIVYDSPSSNVAGNKIYITATGSLMNTVDTHMDNNATNNTVRYTLANAYGRYGIFFTHIAGSGGNAANLNQVTMNLTGDVHGDRVYADIIGNAGSNSIANTVTNSFDNFILTLVGNNEGGPVSPMATNGNKVSNTVGVIGKSTNVNEVQAAFVSGSANNSVTTRVNGSSNVVGTGFGAYFDASESGFSFHDPILLKDNIVNVTVTGDRNTAVTYITGNANQVGIFETSSGLAAADFGNVARVNLYGNANIGNFYLTGKNNTASVTITGSGNKGINGKYAYAMIDQNGSGNTASLYINGSNNIAEIIQSGMNDKATLNINCTGCIHTLTQTGNNMTATVTRTSPADNPKTGK